MSNSLVSKYRSLQPEDPRSDSDLIQLFGQQHDVDGRYKDFPDFVEEYTKSKPQAPVEDLDLPPSVGVEFGKALQAGGESLKQSATGMGALIASYGGWDSLSKKLLKSYQEQVEAGAENAPKIPNIEDIKSPNDFALYLAAKAGGLAPVLGEAVATGAAGAVAGSLVAPGPGTVTGAGAGLVEGFLGRQAAKSVLKMSVEKMAKRFGMEEAATVALRKQLQKIASKEIADVALSDSAKKVLVEEATAIAKRYGSTGANLLNFYGIGAGATYGQLSNTEGVTDADAKVGSAIAGAGSAAGVLLPAYITSRLFPGVAENVSNEYFKRLRADAIREIPAAAAGNGLMAVASIAAEKYADPKKRNEGWTDDDTSRLLNELAVGGALGAVTSPLTALKGPSRTPKIDPAIEENLKTVTPERRAEIEELKGRVEGGNQNLADDAALRSLTPAERMFYPLAKAVPLQDQTVEQVNQTPPPVEPPAGPAIEPTAASAPAAVVAPPAPAVAPAPPIPAAAPKADLRAASVAPLQGTDVGLLDAAKSRVQSAAAKTETNPTKAQKEAAPAIRTAEDLASMAADDFNAYRKGLGIDQTAEQRRLATDHGAEMLELIGNASMKRAEKLMADAVEAKNPDMMGAALSEQQRSQFFMEAAGKSGNAETLAKVEVPKPVEPPVSIPSTSSEVPKMDMPPMFRPVVDGTPKVESKTLKDISKRLVAKSDKIAAIKARMEELKQSKPLPEFKRPTGESGFVINPQDFKLLDPEYLALVAEMSKEVISAGALKFAHYAVKMTEQLGDILGDLTKPVILHAYEAARGELRKSDRETHAKMTPLDKMGDEFFKLEAKTAKEAKVYHTDYRIRPQDVDVERAGTVDKSSRGSKTGQKVVEPAYFVPKEKTEAKLAERLLAQSSPPSLVNGRSPANTLTYRLAAVLDNETGNVNLVSVWNNHGAANLTKFISDIGSSKGVRLSELLKAKTTDGAPRFQVIASIKTKHLNEYYNQVYMNRKAFRDEFAIDADTQQKRVAETGRIEEQKMQSAGIEQGAAAKAARAEEVAGAAREGIELDEKAIPESTTAIGDQNKPNIREGEDMGQTVEEEAPVLDPNAPIATSEKGTKVNLDVHEVDELRKSLPGFATYDEFADIVASNHPPLPDELYDVIEKALLQDPHFFTRIFHNGLEQTIKDHVNANDNSRAGKAVEQGTPAPTPADRPSPEVSGPERGRVPDSQPEPVRQDHPREVAEPRGEQGDAVAGQDAGTGENQVAFTTNETPNEQVISGRDQAGQQAQADRFIAAASAAGINVRGVKAEVIREAAKALGVTEEQLVGSGAVNPETRTILHVLSDATGKTATTPRVIVHEVGHIAFRDETPEVRDRLVRATTKLADDALGVDVSTDPRIRATDPAKLGDRALQEERLVEATTLKMMREGFDPVQAKTFAQKFVRQMKDMYFRSVMAIQRMIGQAENPELAHRYFDNRVRQLLAGDRVTSYLDFVNAKALNVAERWNYQFNNGDIIGERMTPDGRLEYDSADDLTADGARFNNDKLMFTTADKNDPQYGDKLRTELEQRVSVINHLIDTIGAAADVLDKDPVIKEAATAANLSPKKYLLRTLRADDPAEAKADLNKHRETGGEDSGFDPSKKLEDFKSEAILGPNRRDAYKRVESLHSRAGNRIVKNNMDISVLENKASKLEQRKSVAKEAADEMRAVKKDTSVSVPKLDETLARREVALESVSKKLSNTNRRIERLKTENAALEKVIPVFEAEKTRLGSKMGIGTEFEYGNNAIYNGAIAHPEMTDAEITGLGKNGKVVTATEIKLDKDGHVENPAELQKHLSQMKAFLDYREHKARNGDVNALSDVYVGVKKQLEQIIANRDFSIRHSAASRFMFGLTLSPTGARLKKAFGSLGANIDRQINAYTSVMEALHPASETIWRTSIRLEKELLNMVPGKFSHETLRRFVLAPAMELWENASDLAEKHGIDSREAIEAYRARVREQVLSNTALAPTVKPVLDKFVAAIVKKVQHQREVSKYFEKQVRDGAGVGGISGMDVRDQSIKATNPATKARETAVRKSVEVGLGAFSRRFSHTGRSTAKALGQSGWAGFNQALEKFSTAITKEMSPEQRAAALKIRDEGRAELLKLTTDEAHGGSVRNNFVAELMNLEERSPFLEPKKDGDLTESSADPEHMRDALVKSGFLENGDLVKLAEAVQAEHGGAGDAHTYATDFLGRLGQIYDGVMRRMGEIDHDTTRPNGIEEMTPSALVDSRVVRHLPGSWFDFHSYDQHDVFNVQQRIASELAFGRGQRGLQKKFIDLTKIVADSSDKVESMRDDLKRGGNPKPTNKQLEEALTKRFGSKQEAIRLMSHEKNAAFIPDAIDEISDFFRSGNSPDGTLKFGARLAGAIGGQMVQNVTSAIRQGEALFSPALKFGVSKEVALAIGHGAKTTIGDAVGSFGQVIGKEWMTGGEDNRLTTKLNLQDPSRVRDWRDAFDPIEGEHPAARFVRTASELTGFGLNRLGANAKHTVFRPLNIFTTTAMGIDRGLTSFAWRLAKIYSGYGMEFYKANRDKLSDPNFKLDAGALGLKGASADSFRRFNDAMARWNIDYDSMVRDAINRGDGTPFTDREAMNLYSLGVAEISSESNISTMPLGAYNNSVMRLLSPLLGWPFRRMMDVLSLGRTPEGKHELAYFARGLAGLTATAVGGLAVSSLANQYSQNFLGKQANLRPVADAPDAKQLALGVFENINRAGTFGLLGELANGMTSAGLGGDNRSIVNLDQRVLALSAAGNIQRAIVAWIHQGEADYANVIRPLATSLGAGGMLQYMQLANKVLGFDNAESRLTARISAQNWLRVVGRTLDMDVRTPSGSFSAPNALSPHIKRMELAAYGNDAADFRDAYTAAVKAAKNEGIADPVGHVKRAFSSRNPLKSVFRTSISESEYQKLLNTMPESGRHDVEQALRYFNSFASQIGATEFDGKPDAKPTDIMKAPRFNSNSLRSLAASRIGQ